jgi:HD-like signal output (HDOD) protein
MDKLQVFQEIHRNLAEGHLDFPTNVQVSLRVRQALDDPNCDIRLAVRLIEAEPIG